MPLDRDSALLLALGASIFVHVLGAGAAAAFRREREVTPGVVREDRVELEWLEPAPEPRPWPQNPQEPQDPQEDFAPPEEPAPTERPPSEPVAPPLAVNATATSPSALEPPETPAESTPPPTEPEPRPTDQRVVPPASLDPRSVALGALDVAPHQVAPQAQPTAEAPDARYRRAEASLDGHLAARAAVRPAVTERPRPRVRRQPDGSYVYAGHAFSARIDRDGQVHFDDQAPVRYAGGGDSANSASVAFGFDLSDGAYRRRGQDPYQAERAWFMRETVEMREELQQEARERDRVTMARRVAGRVQRIWDTEGRTEQARRRRIFALWDDCAEDDADGDAARSAILGWVRRQLPAGSEGAFTPAELASMNANRHSVRAFAPY